MGGYKLYQKFKVKYGTPLLLIIIGILVGITLGTLLLYFIFGNLFDAFNRMNQLRGQPSKTADAMSSLSYVITWILSIYSIVVTAVFSYMVWKINEKSLTISEELKENEKTSNRENRILAERSLEISEELKRIEENREFESKREKALIVYYDLQRGFSIIRNLYCKYILKNDKILLEKVFFGENWIENVASLRNELISEDIHELYSIYNSLYTIQSYLESEIENDKFILYLEKIANEFFVDTVPSTLLDRMIDCDVDELLSVENYLLLHKIYKLTFNNTEVNMVDQKILISNVNHYEIISGDYYNGEGIIYNSFGNIKLEGYIVNGVFASGTYTGWKSAVTKQYEINYESTSNRRVIQSSIVNNNIIKPLSEPLINATYQKGIPFEGKIIEMRNNGTIAYWGDISKGERNGFGKQFDQKGLIKFEGEFEDSERSKGKLYDNGKLIFDGQFSGRRPWNGKVYRMNFDSLSIKEFTGDISEGKPVKGQGYVFKRSSHFSNIQEKQQSEYADDYWYEQQEEMNNFEEYEEERSMLHNDNVRSKYYEWEDFIYAEWRNGIYIEAEDKESNINVYYYPYSEIKKK